MFCCSAVPEILYIAALGLWMGTKFFFTVVAAPAVFRVLDRPAAGRVVGALFPSYYRLGILCGVVLVSVTVPRAFLMPGSAALTALVVLFSLMTAVTAYSGTILLGKTHDLGAAIRTETDAAAKEALDARFRALHGLSMALNILVMALGTAAVILSPSFFH